MSTFGEELKKIRKKRKLRQVDFAKELNISMQSYGAIERNMLRSVTKNMRSIAESELLTESEKRPLRKAIAKESKDELKGLGDTFGDELKRIRLTKSMSITGFADYLGVNRNTYIGIESSRRSPGAKTSVAISKHEKFTQEQRNKLQKHIPREKLNPKAFKKRIAKEPEEKKQTLITDAQRLDYRRRKNEKYAREMGLPQKSK